MQDDDEPNFAKMSAPMLEALGDDAHKWATAFCQFHPVMPYETMVTWFANAIETADAHRARRMRDAYESIKPCPKDTPTRDAS